MKNTPEIFTNLVTDYLRKNNYKIVLEEANKSYIKYIATNSIVFIDVTLYFSESEILIKCCKAMENIELNKSSFKDINFIIESINKEDVIKPTYCYPNLMKQHDGFQQYCRQVLFTFTSIKIF